MLRGIDARVDVVQRIDAMPHAAAADEFNGQQQVKTGSDALRDGRVIS